MILAALAIGTAIGVAIAPWLTAGPWALAGLLGVPALRGRPVCQAVLIAMLMIGPAAWWAELRRPMPGPDDVSWQAPRRFVRLTGTIATPPERRSDEWRAEVELGHGRIMATWPAPTRAWVGDRWTFAGRLSRPRGPDNPGGFDAQAYWARRGIFATYHAESARPCGPDPAFRAPQWLDRMRMRLLAGLGTGLSPDRSALFGSLALGGGAAPVDQGTAQAFRRLGLSHLLAASGSQVGLLAGLLYAIARRLGARAGWAAVWTAPWLVLYWLLTGAPASMTRATIMGLVALAGLGMARRTVPFATLWLTGWVMLLAEPGCLFDVGFQFSWLASYALTRLGGLMRAHALPGPAWLWGPLLVPVVAWMWVSPLQVSVFHTWSWLALPANWLAAPMILVLTPWGLGLAGVGAVWPPVAQLVSPVSNALLGVLETLVGTMAALPGLERSASGWPWWGLLACYGALGLGMRHPRGAIACALVALMALVAPPPRSPLELSFLSVGQGDALVIHAPGDRWILVDAGPADENNDAGAAVVLPFLRRAGCNRLDLVVASHAHQDHIGGLPAVMRALPAVAAWDAGQTEPAGCNQALLAGYLSLGVPWRVARPGLVWDADGLRLRVLAPWPGRHTVNDGSIVMRLDYGRFSALLTGDAETVSETAMRRAGVPLAATVLKVGHHGSATSTSPAFLAAVRPALAVVSVGRHNRFGHPVGAVMGRLRASGAAIARTDLAGCVRVRTDGRSWAYTTGADEGATWRVGSRISTDSGSRRKVI